MNILTEQPLSLRQAASRLPGNSGKSMSYYTLWKYARRGHRGINLETKPLGGRLVTSMEAVQRFMDRLERALAVPELVVNHADVDRRLREKHGI